MKDATSKACVGMVCITAMEIAALIAGIDGTVFSLAVGAVGTIAGGATIAAYMKGKKK